MASPRVAASRARFPSEDSANTERRPTGLGEEGLQILDLARDLARRGVTTVARPRWAVSHRFFTLSKDVVGDLRGWSTWT